MKKRNQSGFTLIELITGMLVSVIVMLGVVLLVSVGTRQYGFTSSDVSLQMEGQTALSQISDMVLQADEIPVGTGGYLLNNEEYSVIAFDSAVYSENGSRKSRSCNFLVLKKDVRTVYYSEMDVNRINTAFSEVLSPAVNEESSIAGQLSQAAAAAAIAQNISENKQENLLAEHVTELSLQEENEGSGVVKVTMKLGLGSKVSTVSGQYRIRNAAWK